MIVTSSPISKWQNNAPPWQPGRIPERISALSGRSFLIRITGWLSPRCCQPPTGCCDWPIAARCWQRGEHDRKLSSGCQPMVNSPPAYTAVRRRAYIRSATCARVHGYTCICGRIYREKEIEIIEYTFSSVLTRFIYSWSGATPTWGPLSDIAAKSAFTIVLIVAVTDLFRCNHRSSKKTCNWTSRVFNVAQFYFYYN